MIKILEKGDVQHTEVNHEHLLFPQGRSLIGSVNRLESVKDPRTILWEPVKLIEG